MSAQVPHASSAILRATLAGARTLGHWLVAQARAPIRLPLIEVPFALDDDADAAPAGPQTPDIPRREDGSVS